MQRRTFLQTGLVGTALLAVGGVGLHAWPTDRKYAPRHRLKAIGQIEFPILCHVAARFAPKGDPVEVAHGVDDLLYSAERESWRELNLFLQSFESALVGLLVDLRPTPFSHLSPEKQDAALRALRDSRIALRRSGYAVLSKLCAAAYYNVEARWAEVGYPGPPEIVSPMAAAQSMKPTKPSEPAR